MNTSDMFEQSAIKDVLDLVARLFLGSIFAISGFNKIGGYEGTQAYMNSMGVPGELLPLVIVVELVAGLALMAGLYSKIAAFLLAGFCLLAGFLFHFDPQDQMQTILLMKNIAITGGLLMVFVHGSGNYSLMKMFKDDI